MARALLRQLSVFYQHEDGPAYVHHALAREYGLEKPKKRARDAEDAERREEEEQDALLRLPTAELQVDIREHQNH